MRGFSNQTKQGESSFVKREKVKQILKNESFSKKKKKKNPHYWNRIGNRIRFAWECFSASLIPGHREQKVSSMSLLLFEML